MVEPSTTIHPRCRYHGLGSFHPFRGSSQRGGRVENWIAIRRVRSAESHIILPSLSQNEIPQVLGFREG